MTVRKRGTIWYYDFQIRGTRYREALPEARTKGEAQEAETKARREVFDNAWQSKRSPAPATLQAFIDEYEPIARETTRRFSCNAGYELRVIAEAFGARPLSEITHFEIAKWLIEIRPIYAGATINHFIKRLKVIYSRAAASGRIEAGRNPMRLISKVEETPLAKRRLDREEEARLIAAARELGFDYVASAIICRIETGLRPQEFAEMTRDQVHLSEGFILARSYKGKGGQIRERAIPLTIRAQTGFACLLQARLLNAAAADRIFPYNSIKKAWARVCEAAGVEEFWYRWLRDEAASRWAEAGLDAFTIAQLLGHSSPKTSMIYVRAWAAETARKMEASSKQANVSNVSQAEGGRVIRMPVNR